MCRRICRDRGSLQIRRMGGLLKRQLIVIATNKGPKKKAVPVYIVTSPLICKTFFIYVEFLVRLIDTRP